MNSTEFDYDRLERRLAPLPYPHRHDFYQIVWMTRGSGPHVIDSVDYPVRKNSLYFLSPGQVHSLGLSRDATGYVMNFSAEFFLLRPQDKDSLNQIPFFAIDHAKCALYVSDEQAEALREVMNRIEEEYYARQPGYQDILRLYLHAFLMLARRFSSSLEEKRVALREYVLTRKFRMLVEDRFLTLTSAREYSELLNVTERHLSEAARKATGSTANEIIRERLMLEAKRMLIHSGLNISQIAHRLNFDDPAYFSRFFKKHTGLTPGDYKKQFTDKVAWL